MARYANLYRTSILLGISELQVTELIKKGELELYVTNSHTPLIEEKSIYAYIQTRDTTTKNDLVYCQSQASSPSPMVGRQEMRRWAHPIGISVICSSL